MRRRRLRRLDDFRTGELAVGAGILLIAVAGLLLVLASRDDNGGGDAGGGAPSASASRAPYPESPARPCARPDTPAAPPQATRRPAHFALGQAASADAFVESIGVNVHLGYTDTPYARRDRVARKLRELGVRYVRDGLNPGQPEVYAAWRALASCGIRLDLLVGDPLQRHGIGSLESQLALIRRERLQSALVSIEGPNELDIQGVPDWRPRLLGFLPQLRRLVGSDPTLSDVPVVGPSIVRPRSKGELGDVSRFFDYGNIHPYPGGQPPDREAHLTKELASAAVNSRSRPVQATETGYHNAVRSQAPHLPASERAAGIYMPRLYLDYFRRGIARTFAYELLDERPDPEHTSQEADFGLLRTDFAEKPAFVALKRLVALLRDPGPPFASGRLRYELRGARSGLRQLLLEKRDGSFYLALWDDDSVWDPKARRTVHTPRHTLRLVLAHRARQLSVFRPTDSGRAQLTRSNAGSLPLPASASVAIVQIKP